MTVDGASAGMPATRQELEACLRDARARTLTLLADVRGGAWHGPRLEIVNPRLWELGHIGWFMEHWILRRRAGRGPLRDDADRLWDSSRVAHETRWDLLLPSPAATLAFVGQVLDQVLSRLAEVELTEQELYFHRLVLFHEDMHGEALAYTRQTLGESAPPDLPERLAVRVASAGDDLAFEGGSWSLGAGRADSWSFDNEQWEHEVRLPGFAMARAPVRETEFAEFVEQDGYARRELWSEEGWRWRSVAGADLPLYWVRDGASWSVRRFDRCEALDPQRPVIHVSAHEAEAFARWAGRRLPSEAEWERAAARLEGVGHAWEWTATTFAPYPGFEPGPYADYSQPWFGSRRVLRGAAFATRARLIRPRFRNFYTPDRRDIFAGFRTAAPRP